MTIEDILKLEPGRDLDEQVALHCLGYQKWSKGLNNSDCSLYFIAKNDRLADEDFADNVAIGVYILATDDAVRFADWSRALPHFSTNEATAYGLLKPMMQEFGRAGVGMPIELFELEGHEGHVQAWAGNVVAFGPVPLAICQAFLCAKMRAAQNNETESAAPIPADTEPIHSFFELSYAHYLTIPRSALQSMPVDWQKYFVGCLNELDDAFDWRPKPGTGYAVELRTLPENPDDAEDEGVAIDDPLLDYERGRRRLGHRQKDGG